MQQLQFYNGLFDIFHVLISWSEDANCMRLGYNSQIIFLFVFLLCKRSFFLTYFFKDPFHDSTLREVAAIISYLNFLFIYLSPKFKHGVISKTSLILQSPPKIKCEMCMFIKEFNLI